MGTQLVRSGDGRWQITATGSCGHKNDTYVEDEDGEEPDPEEVEIIGIALGREPCAECRNKIGL